MNGFWLAGALMVVAAGASRTATPPPMPDMSGATEEDVRLMLGRPDVRSVVVVPNAAAGASIVAVCEWAHGDWLGGRQARRVTFFDGIAAWNKDEYKPFADAPPWLAVLRTVFRR